MLRFHCPSELHFVLRCLHCQFLVRPFFRGRYSFITNWTSFTCPFDVGSLRAAGRKEKTTKIWDWKKKVSKMKVNQRWSVNIQRNLVILNVKFNDFTDLNVEDFSLHFAATWGERFDLGLSHSAWEFPQRKSHQRGCGVPREQRYYGFEPQRNLKLNTLSDLLCSRFVWISCEISYQSSKSQLVTTPTSKPTRRKTLSQSRRFRICLTHWDPRCEYGSKQRLRLDHCDCHRKCVCDWIFNLIILWSIVFYENRESIQRASNQRSKKINIDKHK